jgi:putative ABC transport system ATP-binding protein
MIQLQNLKKIFYAQEVETWALNDLHLTIDRGEYVSISGPSGCGKSTLLSVIGLMYSCTEGQYLLNGEEVTTLDQVEQARVRREMFGFIFQAFNLIPDLRVSQNVALPLMYRKDLSRNERADLVASALEQVGMSDRQGHFPSQLSGGQQQRVAIARAIVGKPPVLLADEPTGNLDSRNARIVMDLLTGLHRQGCTLVVVTHDPRWAKRANRQISLFDGKIVGDQQLQDAAVVEVETIQTAS